MKRGMGMNLTTQTMFISMVFGFVFLFVERSRGQTTILSEGFEGAFPGTWSLGDSNPSGTTAYWKGVNLSSFGNPPIHGTGSWAGYCAGIGYGGTTLNPTYQNAMDAYMSRIINLSGYNNASFSFWYIIPSIESGHDDWYGWGCSSSFARWQR